MLTQDVFSLLLYQDLHINRAITLMEDKVQTDYFIYELYSESAVLLKGEEEHETEQDGPEGVAGCTDEL